VIGGGDGLELAGGGRVLSQDVGTKTVDQELLALLPASAMTVRLGADLQTDMNNWSSAGVLDSEVLRSANVQSLAEQTDGPYAFYVDGSSPVKAFGLVAALSPTVRNQLMIGDQALEEGLTALVPLLTGRSAITPVQFNEAAYMGERLAYANLSTTQALDYALVDDYLLVATSKDAMFALMDTVAGKNEAFISDVRYTELLALWGAVPIGRDFVVGELKDPLLKQLLPVAEGSDGVAFAVLRQSSEESSTSMMQGVIKLVD